MSNSPHSEKGKASGDSPCDCFTKATSSQLSAGGHEISPQEDEQEQEVIKKGDAEEYCDGGRAASRDLLADDNHPQEGYGEVPGCARDEAAATGRGGGGGGGDDAGDELVDVDGYHTPTSPSQRIPTDLECPPAPRKSPAQRRWPKRKAGVQEFFHQQVVRRRLLPVPDDLEPVFFPVVDGDPAGATPPNKKPAGGDDLHG